MTKLPSFDRLLWMAENTPEKLDALQKRLSKEAIAQSRQSNQASLTSLLDDLDKRLALCKTPYQRCHLVSSLMFKKLAKLNQVYCQPEEFLKHRAEVVPLRKTAK
ncbi:DUF3135 domain-containing protein [Shewanella schlegeliana]|uniref:DUF3135 domain-containing protein n=1 Tax=Shewanella schlegeliana TaxID=190308 RepID=A0ABS1T323_9GAMM|nr:DUF3135 domain-containing protein [Shewanella schlegeliana]MBL4915192.1 DUF3135 domain-containing protein [Shewanella schlegeliana]MCL1110940.1 DUF3135 domain-containing protein [Shewanella schlegeliana]GIU29518.1 hypothetical protein TUM4433_18940 [Shewanella schlegeliana]